MSTASILSGTTNVLSPILGEAEGSTDYDSSSERPAPNIIFCHSAYGGMTPLGPAYPPLQPTQFRRLSGGNLIYGRDGMPEIALPPGYLIGDEKRWE
ncbi:unnamed protein product [Cyprideis torosa]|uniref:Uncharacterized protein n=1 Tax=Cyprideis torosa TaxID=163714 RepID=A0A7R8WGQ8_9CRUS|nr:unnamed protein product [Cyprideis torosa]CAG0892035.1 unnamed protein product [Cyprideis torosa]